MSFAKFPPRLEALDLTSTTAFSASLTLLLIICPAVYLTSRWLGSSRSSSPSLTIMADVRVSKILVHPIKSCRGISVQSSRYTREGLESDRKWCIIEADDKKVITAREFPKMVLITPNIKDVDPASPHSGVLTVSFPDESDCKPFSVPLSPNQATLDSWKRLEKILMWHVPFDAYICEALPGSSSPSPSEVLSSYFGRPVHLVYKGAQLRPVDPTPTHPKLEATAVFQDCYPLMVLSQESTARIEEELRGHVGKQGIDERWSTEKLVIERFRPNVVFEGAGPFAEDAWEEIRIGSLPDAPVITLVSKCTRCLLPNVSPETGVMDKAVPYKTLIKFRRVDPAAPMKACVGTNGCPQGEGLIRVGDCVAARTRL
ncbi:MOSC N-terminal beta barrel domain-containing protein [Mycena olivaceomarginata]|nr:MOSC N-terminal beta barrel domain-containing protein [Mycena olivaceomarginata]